MWHNKDRTTYSYCKEVFSMSLFFSTIMSLTIIYMCRNKIAWNEPQKMNFYGTKEEADAYRSAFEKKNITVQNKF